MFEELYISDINKEILENQINYGNTSHCYIFSGPDGTQKKKTALEFSKALLCNSKDRPCGKCPSCKKFDHNTHPDLIDIFPQDRSIKIGQIREMQRLMNIKPYESNYKVFIVNKSDTMGIPAQNSLLKSLEEPRGKIVIILITKSIVSLLPTILSRGQLIRFNPIDECKFKMIIRDKYSLNDVQVSDLYDLSQGCIDKAVGLIESKDKIDTFFYLKSQIKSIASGEYYKIFQLSNWTKENKVDQNSIIEMLILIFDNVLKSKFIRRGDIYGEISRYLTYESIHDIIQELVQIERSIKHNINFQLQIEKILLKIQEENLNNGKSCRRTF